jgi:hypothetical protein
VYQPGGFWTSRQATVIIRLLVFLSDFLWPLPSSTACYNSIVRLSVRCNRLLQPCGFHTFFATSPDEVFSASLITAEAVSWVSFIPLTSFIRRTILQSLTIFLNCCFKLNQQLQPVLNTITLQAANQ